jgi:hypothetical protein
MVWEISAKGSGTGSLPVGLMGWPKATGQAGSLSHYPAALLPTFLRELTLPTGAWFHPI